MRTGHIVAVRYIADWDELSKRPPERTHRVNERGYYYGRKWGWPKDCLGIIPQRTAVMAHFPIREWVIYRPWQPSDLA